MRMSLALRCSSGMVADPVYPMPARKPDRKSTRLNSSHSQISYAVFCLKKNKQSHLEDTQNQQQAAALLDSYSDPSRSTQIVSMQMSDIITPSITDMHSNIRSRPPRFNA